MSETNIFRSPTHFTEPVSFGGTVTLPDGAITDVKVAAGAGISADKVITRTRAQFAIGAIDDDAASGSHTVYTAFAAGSLRLFKAGLVTANDGEATVVVSLKKNGSAISNSGITFDESDEDGAAAKTAPMAVITLAAGDRIDLVIVATEGEGTIGAGLYGMVEVDEAPL